MSKRRITNGIEQDAYTYARKFFHWRAGVIKKIKRSTHKRERQEGKIEINNIKKELE